MARARTALVNPPTSSLRATSRVDGRGWMTWTRLVTRYDLSRCRNRRRAASVHPAGRWGGRIGIRGRQVACQPTRTWSSRPC